VIWVNDTGVDGHYISSGKPLQNGRVGSVNASLCDECLNGAIFDSLADARLKPALWNCVHYTVGPQSSLGNPSPRKSAPITCAS
jgi:putative transposase